MATSSRRATERRKTYFARKERKHGAERTGGGGSVGGAPRPPAAAAAARQAGGVRGRSIPLPDRSVKHCVGWLTCLTCAEQTGSRASRAPNKLIHRRLQPWAVKISIPLH